MFNSHNSKGIKFTTRLWGGPSHLQEHKFKHSFQDSINLFCNCSLEIESTAHYLLHCLGYLTRIHTLLSTIENIDNNTLDLSELVLIKTFLLAVIELIQILIQMFSMQLLYSKDLKNHFFNEVKNIQRRLWLQILYFNSYFLLFVDCFPRGFFFSFPAALTTLVTWWLSLLIAQCMI